MAYEVFIKPAAIKDLDKLDSRELIHIIKRIERLEENPRPIGVQKLNNAEGYRIRSGRYRILYQVNDKDRCVNIYRIKHRKDAYK